jgi:drug/metabolite transporter (DMT)-like permease
MIPLFWIVKRQVFPRIPKGMQWIPVILIGTLQTAGAMAFLNFGLQETTAARAALLMASNPLVVAILSIIFLRESLSRIAALGLFTAFIGVLVSIGSHALSGNGCVGRGEALVACASLCWAFSTTAAKRIGKKLDVFTLAFWQMLTGSILLVGIACANGQPLQFPHGYGVWFSLLWLAVPASTGAMITWFAALEMGGAVRTSGFLFLCPVFSAVIAFFVRNERISSHEIVGAALVGIGLIVLSRQQALSKREEIDPVCVAPSGRHQRISGHGRV